MAKPIDDSYTGLHLAAGQHTLEGQDALAFLRSRHGVGDGSDLARISSQQVFLSALLRKVASDGTLSNPVTLYKLAGAALSNMTLSDGLAQTRTLVGLASTLRGMSTSDMLFVQYPVVDDPSDTAHVLVDEAAAHELNVVLQQDRKTSLSDSTTGRASGGVPDRGQHAGHGHGAERGAGRQRRRLGRCAVRCCIRCCAGCRHADGDAAALEHLRAVRLRADLLRRELSPSGTGTDAVTRTGVRTGAVGDGSRPVASGRASRPGARKDRRGGAPAVVPTGRGPA